MMDTIQNIRGLAGTMKHIMCPKSGLISKSNGSKWFGNYFSGVRAKLLDQNLFMMAFSLRTSKTASFMGKSYDWEIALFLLFTSGALI